MSSESDLYSLLTAHAPLVALVEARIYPSALPEGAAMPAVVYKRVGTTSEYGLDTALHARQTVFQLLCMGLEQDDADAVGDAAMDALDAAGWPIEDRTSDYVEEVGAHAAILETSDWVT